MPSNTKKRREAPPGGAQVIVLRTRRANGFAPGTASAPAEPLRILFVIDELDIGGTEQQILEIVRRIDRSRFTPQVCCFRYGRKAAEIAALGVPVMHQPKRLKTDPSLVLRLAALMRRERFDIVQTYLWTANTWARIAARIAGVPHVVASERNVDIWEESYKRVVGRWLARSTDRIIANSEAVRSYLLERGSLEPDKVVTVYNGVNFDRFRAAFDPTPRRTELGLPTDAVLAGVVARVEPAKDHATLLKAFALCGERVPKLHLAIVGDGSEQARLKRMARDLNVADRVHFTGMRSDAVEWLQTFDVSVLSSVKEGLSNTVLESMAAGKPVIATTVGGNPEVIVDGETGFLVPARDPAALAAALARVASSPEMISRLGKEGRKRVNAMFSVARMVAHTERVYLELVRPGTKVAA
jgi:glycosyltransferase involved in cell wall biosynthesis